MTLIIGSQGSMGKRYQAILRFLEEPYDCFDPSLALSSYPSEKFSRFIIASPTKTHLDWVKHLDRFNRPILCEKPLSKDLKEVDEILSCQSPISMMMQYAYLADKDSYGRSAYNYYHHGADGLIWDCFQVIALAKTNEIELREDSPIWKCIINGKKISRGDMDMAYVEAVRYWLKGFHVKRSDLRDWHHKVKAFEAK